MATKKTTTKAAEVKSVKKENVEMKETKKVNETKKNAALNIQDIEKLYDKVGLACANKGAKGNYRIIVRKGSSLNILPNKGEYVIYSTDDDFDLVVAANIEGVTCEKGTNTDKCRANTVRCTDEKVLEKLLKVYASNPNNQIVTTEEIQ